MNSPSYFDRLVVSAERIAHHPFYPGKCQAVALCLEDAEGLMLAGRITADQRDVLRRILTGSASQAA